MSDRIHFHWQNLNDKPGGRQGWGLRHGRAWLRVLSGGINVCWSFFGRGSGGCSVRATQSEEIGFRYHVGVPFLFAFFVTVYGGPFAAVARWLLKRSNAGYDDRDTSLRFHDWAMWWTVWRDPHSWSSDVPWYREGSFHIDRFLLGDRQYSERTLSVTPTAVAMPEATYEASVRLFEATWKRPRWFALRIVRAEVKVPSGIPFPGKGENSWDCGEDAVFGQTSNSATVEAAVASIVESVLRSRRRYGGSVNWKPSKRGVA